MSKFKRREPITSVVPLNFALRAKTNRVRIPWWIITTVDLAAFSYITMMLILNYLKEPTSAVIQRHRNYMPFPAVTLCNLNPYKMSEINKIPEMAALIYQFNSLSNPSNPEIVTNASVVNRRKRQAGCNCSMAAPRVQCTAKGSTYELFGNANTWACGYQCCDQRKCLFGQSGSRLAFPDSLSADGAMFNSGVIPLTGPAWCGMQTVSVIGNTSTVSFYSNQSTIVSQYGSFNLTTGTWPNLHLTVGTPLAGGAVSLQQVSGPALSIQTAAVTQAYPIICEYFGPPTTICDVSTTPLTTMISITAKLSTSTSISSSTSSTNSSTSSTSSSTATKSSTSTSSTLTSSTSKILTTTSSSTPTTTTTTTAGTSTSKQSTALSPHTSSTLTASSTVLKSSSTSGSLTSSTSRPLTTSLTRTNGIYTSGSPTATSSTSSTSHSKSSTLASSRLTSSTASPSTKTTAATILTSTKNASSSSTSASKSSSFSSTFTSKQSTSPVKSSTKIPSTGTSKIQSTSQSESSTKISSESKSSTTSKFATSSSARFTSTSETLPTSKITSTTFSKSSTKMATSSSPLLTSKSTTGPSTPGLTSVTSSSSLPTFKSTAMASTSRQGLTSVTSTRTSSSKTTAATTPTRVTNPTVARNSTAATSTATASKPATSPKETTTKISTSSSASSTASSSSTRKSTSQTTGGTSSTSTTASSAELTSSSKTPTSSTVQSSQSTVFTNLSSSSKGKTIATTTIGTSQSTTTPTISTSVSRSEAATSSTPSLQRSSSSPSTLGSSSTTSTTTTTTTTTTTPTTTTPTTTTPTTTTITPPTTTPTTITTSSLTTTTSTTTSTPSTTATPTQSVTQPTLTTKIPIEILNETIHTFLVNISNSSAAMSSTVTDMISYLTAALNPDNVTALGYTKFDVIMRCFYNGNRCYPSDFALKVDANYGNCYTFNGNGTFNVAPTPGATTGLSITYDVGPQEYLPYVQMSGVRVIVHEQNEPIFTDAMGFNAPTGYQTSASMSRIETNVLSLPSKRCIDSTNDVPTYNYNERAYAVEACMRSCYQNQMISTCHCGDPRVPLPQNSNVGQCDVSKRDCINSNYEVTGTCNCPPACHVVDYEITQSITKFSKMYASNITQYMNFNGSSTDKSINRYARIDVYYESLMFTEYVDTRTYPIELLLWDISSLIGLSMGMSMISLFEITKLIAWCNRKYCK